ncbi:Root phototropism protein 2 [Platanthera guangdongensis]|uniref:Root phototropism protein 2 n=1 Tax=Platanthera guangdongensis TaxID=2320717 RepID=A0ABR2LSN6_9ASPA
MAAAAPAAHRLSVAMERTGQWVFSQEIPSDIVIKVEDASFPLHKFILLAKSGYIRRKIMESDRSDLAIIELKGIPGGAEAFEKAARFCYGVNFEISVQNVTALRCAAEWLEMTEKSCEGNLAARADEFLSKAALGTLPGAVAVLNSCEGILAFAEKLRIVQRCVEAIGYKLWRLENLYSRNMELFCSFSEISPPQLLLLQNSFLSHGFWKSNGFFSWNMLRGRTAFLGDSEPERPPSGDPSPRRPSSRFRAHFCT